MKNPFLYGQSVEGEHFCNRIKELADIASHISSAQNLFIYSNRRLGKTSLVREALRRLSKDKMTAPIFIDMERVTSRGQFVEVYARAIAKVVTEFEKLEKVRDFFRSIIPKFEFTPEGEVSVSVEFARDKSAISRCLDEIMDLPQKLAEKYKKRVVVVFDEFQEIEQLNGGDFEKYLRSFIQHHQDVCYIFMGSKTSVIIEMFNDPKRAFYRSAAVYPLKNIPVKEIEKYVVSRFITSGKKISKESAYNLVRLAKGLPYYVQMLGWYVWELCEHEVKVCNLEEGVEELIRSQSELYRAWHDSSTLNQRAVLGALSMEAEIFSQDVILNYGLGSVSTAQSAVKSLVKKGLVCKEESKYWLVDPFFAMWLNKRGAR